MFGNTPGPKPQALTARKLYLSRSPRKERRRVRLEVCMADYGSLFVVSLDMLEGLFGCRGQGVISPY